LVLGKNISRRYRSRLEIIRDILLVVEYAGFKKTNIMFRANLSYELLMRYLKHISNADLIEYDGNSLYMITEKGKSFLKHYKDYEEKCRVVEKHINYLKEESEKLEKMLISIV